MIAPKKNTTDRLVDAVIAVAQTQPDGVFDGKIQDLFAAVREAVRKQQKQERQEAWSQDRKTKKGMAIAWMGPISSATLNAFQVQLDACVQSGFFVNQGYDVTISNVADVRVEPRPSSVQPRPSQPLH